MAVKSDTREGKLILELDNGDFEKFSQARKKWAFKDDQSLVRFVTSILLLNENKYFSIRMDGLQQNIAPVADLLTSKEDADDSK